MAPTTEAVWQEFNIGLKLFILKYVQDEPSAEDILQDVFLKIHTHIGNLKESDKLQSWIFQIARNALPISIAHTNSCLISRMWPMFQEIHLMTLLEIYFLTERERAEIDGKFVSAFIRAQKPL